MPPLPGRRRLPTCLVLDFYDSYTRNILSLVARGLREVDLSLASANETNSDNDGAWDCDDWQKRIIVANVDSLSWDSFVTDILPHLDCVILGPGPGTPHRESDFSWPHRLLEQLGDCLPIFGVCLGCQGLATVFGGKVVEAKAPKHGQISLIRLSPSRTSLQEPAMLGTDHAPVGHLFNGIPPTFSAVQYNSLVVDPASLPNDLEVLAWTDDADGRDEVMALRHREKPLSGVQFHPESIESTYGARLLSNFFSLALAFHASETASSPASFLSQSTKPDLPPHVLALSTSARPPVAAALLPSPGEARWEQRSVVIANVAPGWTVQKAFEQLVKGKSSLGEIWLDSARPTSDPQYSHFAIPQAVWSYSLTGHALTVQTSTGLHSPASSVHQLQPSDNFFSLLSTSHAHLHRHTRLTPSSTPSIPLGFVGYVGYETKDASLPKHSTASRTDTNPDVELAFASTVMSYSHQTGEWTASALVRDGDDSPSDLSAAAFVQDFGVDEAGWRAFLSSVTAVLSSAPPSDSTSPQPASLPPSLTLTPRQSRDEYLSSIRRAQSLIRAGESYELCLTTTFSSTLPPDSPASSALIDDPYPLYLKLRSANPAPYGAYFRLPSSGSPAQVAQGGFAFLSSSPERFLRISATSAGGASSPAPRLKACMKPIKGTARRAADPVADEQRRADLEGDAKERAENLMIVDLIRNDLLATCEVESVEVEKLMQVESYETVHQLVSTVTGLITPGVSPVETLTRAFPPGSMTGAPKMRSCQLLEELEGGQPRGVYSGVFGYLSISGESDWSVVIRTLVKRGEDLTLGAGGAITHLSEPEKEWDEVLTKVKAVLGGLQSQDQ
ncbi:hypothetical protein JCM10207_003780 [Rhodosporidiobolus poonsookiae]